MKRLLFTSDFGTLDHYVTVTKLALLNSLRGRVELLDVSHNIERHDLFKAAYVCAVTAKYTGEDSLHLVVVDPGVGGRRKVVIYQTYYNGVFVAPDNGVLTHAFEWFRGKAYSVSSTELSRGKRLSTTFHGRDVFAPLAGRLLDGVRPEKVGQTTDKRRLKRLPLRRPFAVTGGVTCAVINIDVFGNVVTNLPNMMLDKEWTRIVVNGIRENIHLATTYSSASGTELLLIRGSEGFVEVAVNRGGAAEMLGVQQGEEVTFLET